MVTINAGFKSLSIHDNIFLFEFGIARFQILVSQWLYNFDFMLPSNKHSDILNVLVTRLLVVRWVVSIPYGRPTELFLVLLM